jgi:chemotaxis protein MotB
MAKRKARNTTSTIVIRREEVVEDAHHGGAWKVAYADFVTAMMAFFLLMWLLNATTEEQRRGIADYFSPTATLTKSLSGAGEPLGGRSPFQDGPAVSERGGPPVVNADARPVDVDEDDSDTVAVTVVHKQGDDTAAEGGTRDLSAPGPGQPGAGPGKGAAAPSQKQIEAALRRREKQEFEAAAAEMRAAVGADPALADISDQLSVDMTPEGLRIQIRDKDGKPMFDSGSIQPNERARALLLRIAPALMRLSAPIAIIGHTDSQKFTGAGRSNWDLSAERANATRRLLTDAGLPDERIQSVSGHADREPLIPSDPGAAANRRIAIIVMHARPRAK